MLFLIFIEDFFLVLFFFLFTGIPFLYLFLSQQRRIKGFLRIIARDTRVRTAHYYNDFYWVWQFVNFSFVILLANLLIIYYFIPFTLEELKYYIFCYFLFVLSINWLVQIYIIWFKNVNTFFKGLATQQITLSFGLNLYVHSTAPETNPQVHYYYHSFDPLFGRGYHFHTGSQLEQSNLVKSVMKNSYNSTEFLDKEKYMSQNHFLAYVWANRIEIGACLNEEQKAKFPGWITWSPNLNIPDSTIIKDRSTGNSIGQLKYDSDKRLCIQFNKGVAVELYYISSDLNEDNHKYYNSQATVAGYIEESSASHEAVPMISPVQSQDSADSSSSGISIAGDLARPNSRRFR